MATTEINCGLKERSKPNYQNSNREFYSRLADLTKDLSLVQLEILRDHVASIQPDDLSSTSRPQPALSSRETEVLILVTNGYSRRDIGIALNISINTAARHIANIYHKLGVSCVAEATHYALLNNIVVGSKFGNCNSQ